LIGLFFSEERRGHTRACFHLLLLHYRKEYVHHEQGVLVVGKAGKKVLYLFTSDGNGWMDGFIMLPFEVEPAVSSVTSLHFIELSRNEV